MSGTNTTDAGTMTTEDPGTGNTNTSEVTQPTMAPTMDNGSQSTSASGSVTDAVSGTGTSIQVPTKSPGSTTPMKVPVKPGTVTDVTGDNGSGVTTGVTSDGGSGFTTGKSHDQIHAGNSPIL